MRQVLFALLTLGLMCSPGWAEPDCRLKRAAALEIVPSNPNRVVVIASLGNEPLFLIADTGSYFTMLSERRVSDLGISIITNPNAGLTIYGGYKVTRFAKVSDFMLGTMKAPSYPYPLLPADILDLGAEGLLGQDFLFNFDLDFDLASEKLNLFSPEHCPGNVVYWSQTWSKMPIKVVGRADLYVTVEVDGKEIQAVIDTGSPRSTMSLNTAEKLFGVKDSPLLTSVPGPNGMKGAVLYPFKSLQLADLSLEVPPITLIPDDQTHLGDNGPKMILGMDVLKQLHFYISFKERMLYFTRLQAD